MEFAPHIITIYLLIGAYLALFGRFKSIIDQEFEGLELDSNNASSSTSPTGGKLLIGRVLIVVFSALFWPFFFRSARPTKSKKSSPLIGDTPLKFHSINGYGPITCMSCTHTEKITAFTHGIGEHEDGYQCQACGAFHTIPHDSKKRECECGGPLSREKPLFCPKCKSRRMTYFADYMN